MELSKVVAGLNSVCPPNLAEAVDNVGLLLEPSRPHNVKKALVVGELSEKLVDEAISSGSNMIISYHPPLFAPLKRLTQGHWRERNLIRCAENKIAIYSPHTSLDAKENDLAKKVCITPAVFMGEELIEASCLFDDKFKQFCLALPIPPLCVDMRGPEGRIARFKYPKSQTDAIKGKLSEFSIQPISQEVIAKPNPMTQGSGRIGLLKSKLSLQDVVGKLKTHLGLDKIIVYLGAKKSLSDQVSSVAVCAGSGGSLLTCQPPSLLADAIVTGEAAHQEMNEATSRGVSVLLVGHATLEQKYLTQELLPALKSQLSGVDVVMSREEKDNRQIV